ncbi:hypothetical protein ACFFWC_20680 [Plantactinospora siamensis]|uniref:Uncharacterized protein n=1 Tax=Plantactinospora siamensis TaxID=555372 RepID=A0ABV6NS00_9ACTN
MLFWFCATVYGLVVTGLFVAAIAQPRARGLLLTLGVLGVLAPGALMVLFLWALSHSEIHFG